MIRVEKRDRSDGSIAIKIGRTTTELRTAKEADAFIAGVKIAHLNLAREIMPLLEIKDGKHSL